MGMEGSNWSITELVLIFMAHSVAGRGDLIAPAPRWSVTARVDGPTIVCGPCNQESANEEPQHNAVVAVQIHWAAGIMTWREPLLSLIISLIMSRTGSRAQSQGLP
jgi:hypothetical protein